MAGLFLYGAWRRWADGFVALSTEDSFLFLSPALFDKFSEAGPRTFPYPLFLKICLEHLGGFPAAIFCQKLFGLATAGLTFAAWTRLKGVMNYRPAGTILHDILGLLVLSHLLLEHGTMLYYEQAIMLEGTSALCLAVVIFAACHFFVLVRQEAPLRAVVIWAAALAASSLFAYEWNPRFGLCVPVAFLMALSGLRCARARVAQGLIAILVPVGLSVVLLFVPQYLISRSNGWNRTFIPKHLFYMHARLVLPELTHDRDDPGFKLYRHEMLVQMSTLIQQELALAEREGYGGNFTLKFSPNKLIWGPADGILYNYFGDNPDGYTKFCLYYFKRAVWHHPAAYLLKVAREWIFLFSIPSPILDASLAPYPLKMLIDGGRCLPGAQAMVPRAADSVRPVFQEYVAQLENRGAYDGVVLASPDFIRDVSGWVNDYFSYGVLAALGFCGLYRWRKPREPGSGNLCQLFAGSTLLLISLIAPITLVMTVCGARHIQGLRVMFVFCAATITLLTILLLANLVGARRWFLGAAQDSSPGDQP